MSDWKPANAAVTRIMDAAEKGIGRQDATPACALCQDTGIEMVETELAPSILKADGKALALRGSGARRCVCVTERLARERVASALSVIPDRYRGVSLAGLKPQALRHADQPRLVKDLKANPDRSYFLCGAPDAGKSHCLWALYEHHASQGRAVFAATLFKLIEAITAEMFQRPYPFTVPDLSEPVSIFLEDVNKARPTEFVAERFFNFIDEVYTRKHRLVVTSQVDPAALAAHFERAEGVDGKAIVRRMVNDDTTVWRLF